MTKALLSWSGGKDSTLMLHHLKQSDNTQVVGLFTTLRQSDNVMPIHQVTGQLIEQQAHSLGLPLHTILLPDTPQNNEWETELKKFLDKQPADVSVAYGDLFMQDIKDYREGLHQKWQRPCQFPIWEKDPVTLSQNFIDWGFQAIVTSVNLKHLDSSFAGRLYDASFLNDLPEGVDPCGENGEFHSFVFDGPLFKHPVSYEAAKTQNKVLGQGAHTFGMAYTQLT